MRFDLKITISTALHFPASSQARQLARDEIRGKEMLQMFSA